MPLLSRPAQENLARWGSALRSARRSTRGSSMHLSPGTLLPFRTHGFRSEHLTSFLQLWPDGTVRKNSGLRRYHVGTSFQDRVVDRKLTERVRRHSEAEAGLMHITGEADGPPVKVGVAVTGQSRGPRGCLSASAHERLHLLADLACGLYAKSAILAALLSRATTGQGVHIDANLFDSQLSMLANIGSNYLIAGQEATRQGTAHPR